MTPGSRRAPLLLLVALALLLGGCAKKDEIIVQTSAGKGLTAADIDRDPLALLPGGAVALVVLNTRQMFASPFGRKLLKIVRASVPFPASVGFDPGRDLSRLAVGAYSMQGANMVAVATGTFNEQAIEQAADGTQKTPLGLPLVKSSYAGRTLYTSADVGFVVLTAHTVLLGDETGIRRALDRIKEGRVSRQVPGWLRKLLDTPGAPLVAGFDLRAQPMTNVMRQQFGFLDGLQTARMLGNFKPPGLNLAGTLTYSDDKGAQAGAANLLGLQQSLKSMGWLMSLAGIQQPIKQLQAEAHGADAQFVVGLDGTAVGQLLDQAANALGVPSQPRVIQATPNPGLGGPGK